MSDHENESYSEPEEITDLSSPFVLLKYKTAADIVNKALKGVLTQVLEEMGLSCVVCGWKACL